MAQTPLRDGDPTRIGRFRLSARLGAGAMGVVYLGTAKDGTQAAVKVLRPELADDEEFRARFRREVATLSRVNGLCTVRVIEADTESGMPFLATEYAEGPTLAEQVSATGPLDGDLLLGLAAGLAEALAAIHAAGVIHRDLKPSNVMLTATGPKVIDFGIAQALDSTAVTRTGVVAGSPGFMAPEQLTGQAEQPADIFAWGLTVAFAATGQSPFGTGPTDAILYRIRHEAPDTSGVPESLRALVDEALSKSSAERPAAPAILTALAGKPEQESVSADALTQVMLARTWVLPAADSAGAGQPARSSRGRSRSGRRNRYRLVIPAASVIIVLAAGAGAAAALGRENGNTASGAADTRQAGTRSPSRTPLASPAPRRPTQAPAPPSPAASAVLSPSSSPTPAGSSSPAQEGTVHPGDLVCGFEAPDGAVTVYVAAEHVGDCNEVSAALATFGAYWDPLTADSITRAQDDGMLMDADSVCHLSASSGMLMSVYAVTADGQGALSELGTSVCQSEEQNGWTPHVSTQS